MYLPIGNYVGAYPIDSSSEPGGENGHGSDSGVIIPAYSKYSCAYCENTWQVPGNFLKSEDAKAMEEIAVEHFTRRVLRSEEVYLADSHTIAGDFNRCSRALGSITLCDSCVNYFAESEKRIMEVQKNCLDKMKGPRDFMEVLADPWLDLKKFAFHKLRGIEGMLTERLSIINRMQPRPSGSASSPSPSTSSGLLTTAPNSAQPQILVAPDGFSVEDSNRNGCSANPTRQANATSSSSSDSSFNSIRDVRRRAFSPHSMETMDVSSNFSTAATNMISPNSESQSSAGTTKDETFKDPIVTPNSESQSCSTSGTSKNETVKDPKATTPEQGSSKKAVPDTETELKTPVKSTNLARKTGVPAKFSPVVKLDQVNCDDAQSARSRSATPTPVSHTSDAKPKSMKRKATPSLTVKKGKSKAEVTKKGKMEAPVDKAKKKAVEDSDSDSDSSSSSSSSSESDSDLGEKTEPVEDARKGNKNLKATPKANGKANGKPTLPSPRPKTRFLGTQKSRSTSTEKATPKPSPKKPSSLQLALAAETDADDRNDGNETDFSTRSAPPYRSRRSSVRTKKTPETIAESPEGTDSLPVSPKQAKVAEISAVVFAKKSVPPPPPPVVLENTPKASSPTDNPNNKANKKTTKEKPKEATPPPDPAPNKPKVIQCFVNENGKIVMEGKTPRAEKSKPVENTPKKNLRKDALKPVKENSQKDSAASKTPKKTVNVGKRVLDADSSDDDDDDDDEEELEKKNPPKPSPAVKSPKKPVVVGNRVIQDDDSSDDDDDDVESS